VRGLRGCSAGDDGRCVDTAAHGWLAVGVCAWVWRAVWCSPGHVPQQQSKQSCGGHGVVHLSPWSTMQRSEQPGKIETLRSKHNDIQEISVIKTHATHVCACTAWPQTRSASGASTGKGFSCLVKAACRSGRPARLPSRPGVLPGLFACTSTTAGAKPRRARQCPPSICRSCRAYQCHQAAT
jgi:hypothetical protein